MSKWNNPLEEEYKIYYDENNRKIPSVTEIIKLINKPELLGWANSLGFRNINYKDELNRASVKGILTHQLIEQYINRFGFVDTSHLDDVKISIKSDVLKNFNMFKKWNKEYSPKYLYSEIRLDIKSDNVKQFGGTVDCICQIDGFNYIVDFKTSKSFYEDMFIQLCAYKYLVEYNNIVDVIDRVAILRFDKNNNRYEFAEFHINSSVENIKYFDELLNKFMYLLEVYYSEVKILDKINIRKGGGDGFNRRSYF